MKKLLCLALAALLLLSLAACADRTTPTEAPRPAPSPAEIEAAVAKAVGDGYLAVADVTEDERIMTPLADADMTKIESWLVRQALVTALDLDTVIVVKCSDAAYTDEVVRLLNENYDRLLSYVAQYPFNVSKVQAARLYKVGDTVMFILAGASADAEATEEEAAQLAAAEYTKIDAALKELFGTLPENLAAASR